MMKKGNVTILASIFIMALVASVVGVGTQAWFSDTAKAGVTITAGNVDLQLWDSSTSTWVNSYAFSFPVGFAPGDSYTTTVYLKNTGSAGLRTLWVYGELGRDDNELSKMINIAKVGFLDSSGMVYPGVDGRFYETGAVDGYYIFGNGVAPLTLNEFCTSRTVTTWGYMRFFWGTWANAIDYLPVGGAERRVELTFYFNENAGNVYQDKVCNFNIVFYATDEQGYSVIWNNPG